MQAREKRGIGEAAEGIKVGEEVGASHYEVFGNCISHVWDSCQWNDGGKLAVHEENGCQGLRAHAGAISDGQALD